MKDKGTGASTESVMKRTISRKGGPSDPNPGDTYKKDFQKEGTMAPAKWGECCKGGM